MLSGFRVNRNDFGYSRELEWYTDVAMMRLNLLLDIICLYTFSLDQFSSFF